MRGVLQDVHSEKGGGKRPHTKMGREEWGFKSHRKEERGFFLYIIRARRLQGLIFLFLAKSFTFRKCGGRLGGGKKGRGKNVKCVAINLYAQSADDRGREKREKRKGASGKKKTRSSTKRPNNVMALHHPSLRKKVPARWGEEVQLLRSWAMIQTKGDRESEGALSILTEGKKQSNHARPH